MSRVEFEAYVIQARDVKLALGREALDELADLAYRLAQDRVTRRGGILRAHLARDYGELEDKERAAMRNSARDFIVALVLLGFIEMPGE